MKAHIGVVERWNGALPRLGVRHGAGDRRVCDTLALAAPDFPDTQSVRVDLVRCAIALDPVIAEAFSESSQLRLPKAVSKASLYGLFAALAGWRTVAVCLAQLPG